MEISIFRNDGETLEISERSEIQTLGEIRNDATHEIAKSKMSQNRRFLSTDLMSRFPMLSYGIDLFGLELNPYQMTKFQTSQNCKHFAETKIHMTKIYMTQKLKFVLRRVENFVGRGKNAG